MHLVLIRHTWLERLCWVCGDDRPLSRSWPSRKENPGGPERNHETGRFAVLKFWASGVDFEKDRCPCPDSYRK